VKTTILMLQVDSHPRGVNFHFTCINLNKWGLINSVTRNWQTGNDATCKTVNKCHAELFFMTDATLLHSKTKLTLYGLNAVIHMFFDITHLISKRKRTAPFGNFLFSKHKTFNNCVAIKLLIYGTACLM